MSAYVLHSEGVDQLKLRYEQLNSTLKPGLRRYNAFWSSFESAVAASPTPMACPTGFSPVPANDTDRVNRGYHLFHCFNDATVESFDLLLALDASIGAASAFIVYAAPDWAIHPGCTGFPWGKGPNFKGGCLPWDHLNAWHDYILFITERWHAPWGSGQARLSHLVVWNEVQGCGWADPSPVLPNRYAGPNTWTPAQAQVFATMLANLTLQAGAAASRNSPDDLMLWLSTSHFLTAPVQKEGDVLERDLGEILDIFWPLVNRTVDWALAVHPYDRGDPRANLTSLGFYTFATLNSSVADMQCGYLHSVAGVPRTECYSGAYPQVLMYASEQGWPYNNATMNKTLQARNICYAHGLSLQAGVYAVTHNFFQGPSPGTEGPAGDFSLLNFPPLIFGNLTNGAGHATFDAYAATVPGVYGVDSDNFCCVHWGWGCPSSGESEGLHTARAVL